MAKTNGMTREEAKALYENLHKSMTNWMANGKPKSNAKNQPKIDPKQIARTISQGLKGEDSSNMSLYNRQGGSAFATLPPIKTMDKGQAIALILIMFFAVTKIFFSALEAVGLGSINKAQASIPAQVPNVSFDSYSREDKKVLTSLDARRAELSERGKKIDLREINLEAKENALEVKLAELRQLTSKLKSQREGVDQKRNVQVEQLAKIYSAMSPEEAAKLMEEIDVSIALELMSKMSEKRIGQILSLMDSEKAINFSKMLVNF